MLKNSVIEIIPDIDPEKIKIEESLKDLGANSVDRMDITIRMMELLDLKVPLVEFGDIKNMQSLVDFLYAKKFA